MTVPKRRVSLVRFRSLPLVLLALGALGASGCAVVGPASITHGRGAYTQVINRTEDEQILNVVVRQRYQETFGMLAVASVTASLRFRVEAGAQVGIGDRANYAGSLVPLSGGLAYEENPTISYVPMTGEDFSRRMLSPVTMDEWALITGHIRNSNEVLGLATRRINGLWNPLLGDKPFSPDFGRLLDVYSRLLTAGALDLVRDGETGSYIWQIHDYAGADQEDVRALLDLLGIEVEPDGSTIRLPFRAGVDSSSSEVLVETRSPWEVLRVYGAGIEIPPAHLEAGFAEPVEWAAPEDRRIITIHSSKKRPENATVRVRFRDRWFYIDAADTKSKRAFMFLRTLLGIRMARTADSRQSPVLTVPVN